jgi:hypothetical protein
MFRNILLASAFFATVAQASPAATARKVESLNDLPKVWEGVAGDFSTRKAAKLTVQSIQAVEYRTPIEPGYLNATYSVVANLTVGEGEQAYSIQVTKLTLQGDGAGTFEVSLTFNDELMKGMLTSVRYDEVTDTYLMRDPIVNGARRLSLVGKTR